MAEPKPESTRLVHRGIDLADDENYSGAMRYFTRAIEIDAGNEQAYFERGMAQLGLEKDREAITDFEQALKLDPKYPGARSWLARTLAGLGEHRRAAEEWLRLLRDEPNGDLHMGVSPVDWAECAGEFALAGDRDTAIVLLEEYFAQYRSVSPVRVTRNPTHAAACAPVRRSRQARQSGSHAQARTRQQASRARGSLKLGRHAAPMECMS